MVPDTEIRTNLWVTIFGGPCLFWGGEEIPLSPHQGYLLIRVYGSDGPGVSRTEMVAALWPDKESSLARRNLNQLLYSFKKKLGEFPAFEAWGDELRKSTWDVHSDYRDYEEALEAGSFSTCLDYLDRGFAPQSLGEVTRVHSDWIQARESELRHELRRRVERRWRKTVGEEAWEEAIEPANVLLALAPRDEGRLRMVLEVYAKAGHYSEAEETYAGFSEGRANPEWKPATETMVLLERIRRALAAPASFLRGEPRRAPLEPPLLGRNIERNLFRKSLASPPAVELRAVLISGQAGIGKTRLIRESLLGSALDEHSVCFSQSAELEQLIPLNPLIDAFRGQKAGEALCTLDEPWRTVLFGVMPSHYPGGGPIPEAPHIRSGSVPRRLFEAFFQLLLSLVKAGPMILVLEDLQWADETTLSVLEFLIRRWDQGDLQIVISVRVEEVRKNPVLGRFLENLRVHADFLEIQLNELDPIDSEVLIRRLAEDPLEAETVSRLRSLAGGNPFFIIELTLEFLAGRLGSVVPPQDMVPIPLSIRQVLDRRLSQLRADAERVLGSLAVFGRPLEISGLTWITQLSGPECLCGLDQLHQFRLVASQGTEVVIGHELVRQSVYQGLTETRRAWLHDRVARHLLQAPDSVPPDDLAVHFHRAGASEEARLYSTDAADRAEASGAIPEALRFLHIAREHSKEPAVVADLIGRMGHLNYLHQNLDEAAPLLELAAQRFRRQGKKADALHAEVERIDCLAQQTKDLGKECVEELQGLKQEASSENLWEVFQKALDVEAHHLDREGDLEGIRSVLNEAERNQDEGNTKARCKARAMVALNIYFGPPGKGLQAARDASAIARETGDSELLLYALNRLMVVLHYQGKLHTPEGCQALSEAESRLGTCGDLNLKFNVRLNRAVWHLDIGDLDRARVSLSALLSLVRGTKAFHAQAKLQLNLGELGLAAHDFDFARTAYDSARALFTPTSPHYFSMVAASGLGLCGLLSGKLADAKRWESELPTYPEFWTFDPSLPTIFKARMLVKRQDWNRAISLFDHVREGIRNRLIPAWLRLTLEEARMLKGNQPEKALHLVEEGLSLAENLGLKVRVGQFARLMAPPS